MATNRGFQRRQSPEDFPPEDDLAATDASTVEQPSTPAWTVPPTPLVYEEENARMVTPNVDIHGFTKVSEIVPNGEKTTGSILDVEKTGIAKKVELYRDVQEFVIRSVDNAMAVHAASYQRLLTFNEALVKDTTDGKFKEITRLMIFADLVVRTAALNNSADPLLHMAESLVKEAVGPTYQPTAPKNILNDVYTRIQTLVADRIRFSTDNPAKDDSHALSA